MHLLRKEAIEAFATQTLGFDLCRFCDPFVADHLDDYRQLIEENRIGDMGYLERHLPFKENPSLLLPGVKSAIVLAVSYKNTTNTHLKGKNKMARYAVGKDYHLTIQERLHQLETFIKSQDSTVQTFHGVDSRPIPERTLAIKSGIGFKGKNSMVIRPKLGSYFLIGVVYTTHAFERDEPFLGTCGTCTRCVDACPTQAILPNGKFEPTACISYQTIEHKEPLSKATLSQFEEWIFGCDICQEVCPFNHPNIPFTSWDSFLPDSGIGFHGLNETNPIIPKESALFRSRKRVLANLKIKNGDDLEL